MTVGSAGPGRLARPQLVPLVDELFRRYGEGEGPVTVTLRDLSMDQRRALADLLGADHLPGPTTRVAVARLVAALGIEGETALRSVVEALRGPIADRRAARAVRRQARESLWAWLAEEAALVPFGTEGVSGLALWVEAVRLAGVPGGDVEAHRQRLETVLALLRRLPLDGVALAGLAADEFGDAHALDSGRTSSALVLDAIASVLGRDRPADAEATRLFWEEVGVVPDPLSSTVLTLGLRPEAESSLAAWLRSMTENSEPAALTLAQLRRWPMPPLAPDAVAYVVENPSLLAEAAARQWHGPPLVCSSGRPTFAVVTLLRQLGSGGARLAQHADFDAAGVGITAWLAERAGTTPWRMGERDYTGAVAVSRSALPLRSPVPSTPWDPLLQEAMQVSGIVIHEEELRSDLLSAMAAQVPTAGG